MKPIICCIRYKIGPGKQSEFEHYARVWKGIIERLDGNYIGCFVPGNKPPGSSDFNFPEIAHEGPEDTATVLFSFRDLAGYERYRRDASLDPESPGVTDFCKETQCMTSYERTFIKPLHF